jgi:hypothetical protein
MNLWTMLPVCMDSYERGGLPSAASTSGLIKNWELVITLYCPQELFSRLLFHHKAADNLDA